MPIPYFHHNDTLQKSRTKYFRQNLQKCKLKARQKICNIVGPSLATAHTLEDLNQAG